MAVIEHRNQADDLSRQILEAVAECHDVSPAEIDADLEDSVDIQKLSSLWPATADSGSVYGVVSFAFDDCRVTVTSGGSVEATRMR